MNFIMRIPPAREAPVPVQSLLTEESDMSVN